MENIEEKYYICRAECQALRDELIKDKRRLAVLLREKAQLIERLRAAKAVSAPGRTEQPGIFVYGAGAHLQDMLDWHPQLVQRIVRIFDKDVKKIGRIAPGLKVEIEASSAMADVTAGTEIAISAIKYIEEISEEIHTINPGLICRSMDDVWDEIDGAGIV